MCYKIRCDGKFWKLFGFQGELNMALDSNPALSQECTLRQQWDHSTQYFLPRNLVCARRRSAFNFLQTKALRGSNLSIHIYINKLLYVYPIVPRGRDSIHPQTKLNKELCDCVRAWQQARTALRTRRRWSRPAEEARSLTTSAGRRHTSPAPPGPRRPSSSSPTPSVLSLARAASSPPSQAFLKVLVFLFNLLALKIRFSL